MEKKREIPEEIQKKLESKRFVLSSESFSRERFKDFREVFDKIKSKYPEVLSAHIFGSMTKGYATPESDIDIILFVEDAGLDDDRWLHIETDFNWSLDMRLDIPFSNIEVAPINESLIDELIATAQEKEETAEATDTNWRELAMPFIGISVGDIQKYRKYILDKLAEIPEGEFIWQNVIDYVRRFERNMINLSKSPDSDSYYSDPTQDEPTKDSGQYKALYPQTIQEASRYFVEREPFRQSKPEN